MFPPFFMLMKIILASQSPRRKDILNKAGLRHKAVNHAFDENEVRFKNPSQFVKECAFGKACSIREKYPEGLIIGADTIVYCRRSIIGKPNNKNDARRILKILSGRTHYVYSGISLILGEREIRDYVKTAVTFHKLNDSEIELYLEHADYMDKAGAYAIQEHASMFIEGIRGDYFNIVGFPLTCFREMLYNITSKRYYEYIH